MSRDRAIRSDSPEGQALLRAWRGRGAPLALKRTPAGGHPPAGASETAERSCQTVEIVVPLLAPSLNGPRGLMRMHHRRYARLKATWIAAVLAATTVRGDLSPCTVSIIRHYCPHPLDLDNLYASAKLPLDALRKAGLLADDDPSCVVALAVRQERVARKADVETLITITPL